jgi:hypothetical protein
MQRHKRLMLIFGNGPEEWILVRLWTLLITSSHQTEEGVCQLPGVRCDSGREGKFV